jgi:hypothetical protein
MVDLVLTEDMVAVLRRMVRGEHTEADSMLIEQILAQLPAETLLDRVRQAYSNAIDNGFLELSEMTDEAIATDMITYDSDLEDESLADVAAAVATVRKE